MRKIEEQIIQKILSVLPKELTEAVYIFGSYGTEYFDEESNDLDIGWFTSEKIDLSIRSKYRSLLVNSLNIDIDVVSLTKYSNYNLLCNVFTLPVIMMIGLIDFMTIVHLSHNL